jgi:uncharacterized protein YoxC
MNTGQLTDLKQFITATVSQQTADLATKSDVQRLEHRIDETFELIEGISEVVSDIQQNLSNTKNEVAHLDTRVEKLEQKFA